MSQTLNQQRKKASHKEREFKKFGNQIVKTILEKANSREFWYKKFMDYVLALPFRQRFGIAWGIVQGRRKVKSPDEIRPYPHAKNPFPPKGIKRPEFPTPPPPRKYTD
jgi:hypothetical protein